MNLSVPFSPVSAIANETPCRVVSRARAYARYAWGVLAYCVLTIVWGGFVRASGSGDGCGQNWPSCGGEGVVPILSANWEKTIEASHRLTTGLTLPLIVALLVGSFRLFPRREFKSHPVRTAAWSAFGLVIFEAFIGAVLVKRGWVDTNRSDGRVFLGIVHLVNTFGLISAISLCAWWGGGAPLLKVRGQGPLATALWAALGGALLLGVTGSIAALGNTIFPVKTLADGLAKDFNPASHYLFQLRVWHPWLAATLSLYLILVAGIVSKLRPSPDVLRFTQLMTGVFMTQMLVGVVTLFAKAPIVLQMTHLLLANLTWLSVLMLAVSALAIGVPQIEVAQDDSLVALLAGNERATSENATWKDFVVMTKPRVISLLLLTTVAAMFVAKGEWPGTWLIIATSFGFYMAAGSANTINMVLERDLDIKMKRTASRPTVTQVISSRDALRFAFWMAFGSFVILSVFATTLSALMALSGLVFYVVVYTILLKRRTWQNIVIGGAAGAFPPLVGWAATGHFSVAALVFFALIFVWTPVHFWALALMIKQDYSDAGVPMLPCVHGDRATVVQIVGYAVVTVAVSLVPMWLTTAKGLPLAGNLYLGTAIVLNAFLLLASVRLYRLPDKARASALFHYSMIYLALLFVVLAAERAGWTGAATAFGAGWICFELEKRSRPTVVTAIANESR